MNRIPVTITLRESDDQFNVDIVTADGQTITKSLTACPQAWNFAETIMDDQPPEYYLHSENGPAVIWANRVQEWYRNGVLHREDGPAVIWANGTQVWYRNGECHRDDGPAHIDHDGTQRWIRNGKFHRDDGPAVIWASGTQVWYRNNKQHRDDGPAWIWSDGTREWWLYDKPITMSAERWMEQMNASLPFDEITSVMFRLSFAEYFK